MRILLILLGLAILIAGIWVIIGHGSYTETETLFQIGSAKLTATHDKVIPTWLGIAGIVVGALLAIVGLAGFFSKR